METWPGRAREELNVVSGIAGVGGTVISVAGFTIWSGAAATVISGGGVVLALGAIGYALFKALPPRMKRAEDLVGNTMPIHELDDIYPHPKTLAIIGPSRSGKSTLKSRLSFQATPTDRTQFVEAYLVLVPTTPPTYLAILDGKGDKYTQQFKIAEPCDLLCIIIDHNESETEESISAERLRDHVAFLKQIRDHFLEEKIDRKSWITILLNKRDLWEAASAAQKADFEKFYTEQVRFWKEGNFAYSVTSHTHSNDYPEDIGRFMRELTNLRDMN